MLPSFANRLVGTVVTDILVELADLLVYKLSDLWGFEVDMISNNHCRKDEQDGALEAVHDGDFTKTPVWKDRRTMEDQETSGIFVPWTA